MKAVYRTGRFLSAMGFQNISALIALGMLRVLFGPNGWFPNQDIFKMADPIVIFLIPLLFAYTGGKMLGDQRGGVIAAFVMVGMISANPGPYAMILPAMVIGPAVGYLIRKSDKWLENRVPVGFELLYHNVAAGLVGILLSIAAVLFLSPLFVSAMHAFFHGTEQLAGSHFLPLTALVIQPAKVLFFNNAINHGILEPLGIQQTKEAGQSILFLLETNPGPGLGLLLGYLFYGKGKDKDNIKSSIAILALGGIQEVYFPYALKNPLTMIALILGGVTGDLVFSLLHAGLVATPSSGSILMLMLMAPKGVHLSVLAGFLASTCVSFLLSARILSRRKEEIKQHMEQGGNKEAETHLQQDDGKNVQKIIFACDAGMGSSAMGAAMLRKKLKQADLDIIVEHASVEEIPPDADMVIVQEQLAARARAASSCAEHIYVSSLVDSVFYDKLTDRLKTQSSWNTRKDTQVQKISQTITTDHILLDQDVSSKREAIRQAGELLVKLGHADPAYVDEMRKRERMLSTYIGNGVAIPHGLHSDSTHIKKAGIVISQYPKGVDFGDGNKAYLVIAIAVPGREHLSILAALAVLVESNEDVRKLVHSDNKEDILQLVKDAIPF